MTDKQETRLAIVVITFALALAAFAIGEDVTFKKEDAASAQDRMRIYCAEHPNKVFCTGVKP